MATRLETLGIAERIGALLFIGGAALTAGGTVLPHSAELDTTGFLGAAAAQLVLAAIVIAIAPRLRGTAWVPGAIVFFGILVVSAVVYFNGERDGGPPGFNEFFFVWPAFYFGYFFKRRGILASLALMTVTYGYVVGQIGGDDAAQFTRMVTTISVAAGAAAAMHGLRRNIDGLLARLRDTARTDPLTGLLNRRGFDERLGLELERSRRTGEPLALVLGDLDHFKSLNDRFGHGAGDTALVCVGQTLTAGCRAVDTVARIGGEEFALLIPGSDADGALLAAERLRKSVSGIVDGDGRPLTISFGIVDLPAHGETVQELLYAADRALYGAKSQGRDRAVVSDAAPAAV